MNNYIQLFHMYVITHPRSNIDACKANSYNPGGGRERDQIIIEVFWNPFI